MNEKCIENIYDMGKRLFSYAIANLGKLKSMGNIYDMGQRPFTYVQISEV